MNEKFNYCFAIFIYLSPFFYLVEKSQQLTSLSNRYDKVLVTTYYKERLLEDEISKLNIELNGKNFELDMAINRVEQLNLELGK